MAHQSSRRLPDANAVPGAAATNEMTVSMFIGSSFAEEELEMNDTCVCNVFAVWALNHRTTVVKK